MTTCKWKSITGGKVIFLDMILRGGRGKKGRVKIKISYRKKKKKY